MSNVTCLKCGWVHFPVSREYVRKWQAEWDELFRTKSKEWLAAYGIADNPPGPEQYYSCFRCGGDYKNMRPSKKGDCPDGCTIGPILAANQEKL